MKLLVYYYYFDMPGCDDLSVKPVAKEQDSSNFHCCSTINQMMRVIEMVRGGIDHNEIIKVLQSGESSGPTWRRGQDTGDELEQIRNGYYGGKK